MIEEDQSWYSCVENPMTWFDEAGTPGLVLELDTTPATWVTRAREAWRTLRAWLGGPPC